MTTEDYALGYRAGVEAAAGLFCHTSPDDVVASYIRQVRAAILALLPPPVSPFIAAPLSTSPAPTENERRDA